jgi:hypothetical protein
VSEDTAMSEASELVLVMIVAHSAINILVVRSLKRLIALTELAVLGRGFVVLTSGIAGLG